MFKKWFFLLFVQFLFTLISYAQQSNFFKTYSGIDNIDFFHVDTVHDKGYIISGWSYGLTGGDFLVLKTDSLGNEQWRFINNDFINNTHDNIGRFVRETKDHCFIVTGKIQISSTNYFDIKIAKIDSTGNLIWNRNYDFSNNDQPWELVMGKDSSFYIFGRKSNDVFAIKFNYDGDTIFTKNISNSGCLNNIEKIIRDGSSFLLAGKASQGFSGSKLIVQKLDSLCNPIWCNSYPDSFDLNNFGDIFRFGNSNYATIGTYSKSGIPYSLNIKILDSLGNLQSVQIINSNISGVFKNDSILAAGMESQTLNPDSASLGTLNINNSSIERYGVFYAPNILGRRILIEFGGAIVSVGKMDNGNTSIGYLMKAKPFTTSFVPEIRDLSNKQVSIFEDFLNREIYFKFSDSLINLRCLSIQINNVSGSIVKKFDNIDSGTFKLSTNNFSPGTYFYSVINKNYILSASGKFIIH